MIKIETDVYTSFTKFHMYKYIWYYFPLMTYKKKCLFSLILCIFCCTISESEIRVLRSNPEIRIFVVVFFMFFWFVCLVRIG